VIDDDAHWDHESLGRAARAADWMLDQFSWAAKGAVVEIRAGVGTFSARLLAAGVGSLVLIEPDDVCADVIAERFGTHPRVSIARETLLDPPTLAKSPAMFDFALCQNVLECRRSLRRRPHDRGSRGSGVVLRARSCLPIQGLYGSLDCGLRHQRRHARETLLVAHAEKR
jgi:hypothetical protein